MVSVSLTVLRPHFGGTVKSDAAWQEDEITRVADAHGHRLDDHAVDVIGRVEIHGDRRRRTEAARIEIALDTRYHVSVDVASGPVIGGTHGPQSCAFPRGVRDNLPAQ